MNLELFIAKRIVGRNKGDKNGSKGTKPIISIAIGGIVIGIIIMLLSVFILQGFQEQIRGKVIGFGSHINITSFSNQDGFETEPIKKGLPFYNEIKKIPEVKNIQTYASIAGILKTKEDILGIVIKGIDTDFDWSFFNQNLVSGDTITIKDSKRTNDVLISQKISKKMKLELGDSFIAYFFIDNKPKPRKFNVKGIYSTGMEGFDDLFVLGDIKHIQRLNKWKKDQVGGYEINLKSYNDLGKMDDLIYENIPYEYKTTPITEKHSEIFSWLKFQDINVIIIITLMILVSGINMTSALLILILERTNMIGILKAMGAMNWSIRKVFLYNAAYLIGKGLFWGNLIGLGLAFFQKYTGFISLPQESYYISHVPISINWWYVVLLNIGTMALCILMLTIPSYIVTRISPVKAIRFE